MNWEQSIVSQNFPVKFLKLGIKSLISNPKNTATHLISTLVTYLGYQGNNNFIYSMEIQNL